MKKVGLLVPKTNLTVEYELQYLYNNHFFNIDDIVFYISKLDYKTSYKEDKIKFLKCVNKLCLTMVIEYFHMQVRSVVLVVLYLFKMKTFKLIIFLSEY